MLENFNGNFSFGFIIEPACKFLNRGRVLVWLDRIGEKIYFMKQHLFFTIFKKIFILSSSSVEYFDYKCVFLLNSVQTLKDKERSLAKLSTKVSKRDKERTLKFIRWYHRVAKKHESLYYVNISQTPLPIEFSVINSSKKTEIKKSLAVVNASDSSLINLKILDSAYENSDEIWVWKGDAIFSALNPEFPPPDSDFLTKLSLGDIENEEVVDPSVINFVPSPDPKPEKSNFKCFTPPPEFCD